MTWEPFDILCLSSPNYYEMGIQDTLFAVCTKKKLQLGKTIEKKRNKNIVSFFILGGGGGTSQFKGI